MSAQTISLTGTGATYIRVSTDSQDTERQIASVHDFELRHGVKISDRHWYEDQGWARDFDRQRPDFNRLLGAVRAGEVKWIVINSLNRFGTKNAKRLFGYLGELQEFGCLLYTVDGKEWTNDEAETELQVWLGGKKSEADQRLQSRLILDGMTDGAKAGEYQGGPPKLGFDVACYDRATGVELFRFVWEKREATGTQKDERTGEERPVFCTWRRKVYPDGRVERFDGSNVILRTNPDTQVLRIAPTIDAAKLDAARQVFRRYAAEAVSFCELAKWLNDLGIRNSYCAQFQANDVRTMLMNESYLGYATYGKRRMGRFSRYDSDGGIIEIEPELRGKDKATDPADLIRGPRLFAPIVDRPTWEAVVKKLAGRTTRTRAPKSPALYLSGIVRCANCGSRMVAESGRMIYLCGAWTKWKARNKKETAQAKSPCQRNPVKHALLEEYVNRYLAETKQRLDLLTQGRDAGHLTDRLQGQADDAWREFREGLGRLSTYIAEHYPDEYNAILAEFQRQDEEERGILDGPAAPKGAVAAKVGHQRLSRAIDSFNKKGPSPAVHAHPFVDALVACYRANFDPAAVAQEIATLETQHDQLMAEWRDLPTPRAKEKAKVQLEGIEARISGLEKQQAEGADVVAAQFRTLSELQTAIADATLAMRSETGAAALRQRAERLRGLLVSIDCTFVLTGKTSHGGRGQAHSKLVSVSFSPVAGDGKVFPIEDRRNERQGYTDNALYH